LKAEIVIMWCAPSCDFLSAVEAPDLAMLLVLSTNAPTVTSRPGPRCEGVSNLAEQIPAAAEVAALVAQRNGDLRQRVLDLARALRGLRCPLGETLQRHIEHLLLDAAWAAKRSSCSASTPTPIVSAVLPTAAAPAIERSTSAARPSTVATPARASEGTEARA
jgi:hypothetical protein